MIATEKNIKSSFGNNFLFTQQLCNTKETEIATSLAWAISRDIPFQEALSTLLSPDKLEQRSKFYRFLHKHFFPHKFDYALSCAIKDLDNGVSLHKALKKNLSKHLSPLFLNAIEKAENQGILPQILPELARSLKLNSELKSYYKSSGMYGIVQLSLLVVAMSFIFSAIIPACHKIYTSLLEDVVLPADFQVWIKIWEFCNTKLEYLQIALISFLFLIFIPLKLSDIMKIDYKNTFILFFLILQVFFFIFVPLFTVRLIYRSFKFVFSPVLRLVERYLIFLPFIGAQIRDKIMLDFASTMSALLNAGFDISEAAEWTSCVIPRRWFKKKIAKFADDLKSGAYWADTWEKTGLCTPVENWILRNSASLGSPAEGFTQLAQILNLQIRRRGRAINLIIETALILFNATILGFFAVLMLSVTCHVIYNI